VLMNRFVPAAVVALVCSATPLMAQTQPAAPVQTPAPTQTPGAPAPGAQPPATQTPGAQTPASPTAASPTVQSPTAPTPIVQPPTAQTPAVMQTQTPIGVPVAGSPQTPATGSAVPMTSAPPQPSSPAADTDHGTAIVLLDRIQKLLDSAVTKSGQVTLDRGLVDEMRAEVTQVKMSLQRERP
jgi:hypothetical protein